MDDIDISLSIYIYTYFSVLRGIKCIIINKLLEFLFYFKLFIYILSMKNLGEKKQKQKQKFCRLTVN